MLKQEINEEENHIPQKAPSALGHSEEKLL